VRKDKLRPAGITAAAPSQRLPVRRREARGGAHARLAGMKQQVVAVIGALGALGALGLAACGGGGDTEFDGAPGIDAVPADADDRDLLVQLNALPGVTAVEEDPLEPGTRVFDLTFEQPVDHEASGGAVFHQNVTLVHRDAAAPMIALTTGYWNYQGYYPDELTELLGANQIAIEHRYFASSRPVPTDWSYLTIAQSAADQHHIVELLKPLYPAAWITTGASKGGMTASYHRTFYADDVVGTVPYVAPLSFAAGDPRYADFLDTIGPPACRQALRDLEIELLQDDRWDAMLALATAEAKDQGLEYNRVAIGPATEGAIAGIEWAFWQYVGADSCGQIPPVTASNATMWNFLQVVSAVSGSTDNSLAAFEAYYYQAEFELGYPDGGGDFLAGLLRYDAADYDGYLPVGVEPPVYTPVPMQEVDAWIQGWGHRLLFIYGEWDPWTGGQYELGDATDSLKVTAPEMTHGAGLGTLTAGDRALAFEKLEAWTGVTPGSQKPSAALAGVTRPERPRLPPAMIHALRLRARGR
jgi:hypothetical protein